MKTVMTLGILAQVLITNAQVYYSPISYRPTYEMEVEELHTMIFINEEDSTIVFHNATYEGEITNLKIDSVKLKDWMFQPDKSIKTYFCTDVDEYKYTYNVYVLDLIKKYNTIRLIYRWDDISIEEYSYVVKE